MKREKFAFVGHPLKATELFRHPLFRPLSFAKEFLKLPLEILVSFLPPVKYGVINGIESTFNGKKINGDIYGVFYTPRMMKAVPIEVVYRKLLKITRWAHNTGSSMIGLGAYTKVVGDAGVTVATRANLPVTTGNSLSASSVLWTIDDYFTQFDLANPLNLEIPKSKVMVIGATGSIGAVLTKIIAEKGHDLVLVATREKNLQDLSKDLLSKYPDNKIEISTDPNLHLPECDVVLCSVSTTNEKLLNPLRYKKGAVVCDVSRPSILNEETAQARSDVMFLYNSEIILPGDVQTTCDMGFKTSNTVYACMAEAAILTLEGRAENYSLSRSIEPNKVMEIERMSKKHGAKLASICGPLGIIDKPLAL